MDLRDLLKKRGWYFTPAKVMKFIHEQEKEKEQFPLPIANPPFKIE